MYNTDLRKTPLSIKLGYWSALICTTTFIIFTVCFLAILKINSIFVWTNLSNFVVYSREHNQLFKYVAEFSMIVFGVAYVILLSSVYDNVVEEKKLLAKISIYFGVIFTTLI